MCRTLAAKCALCIRTDALKESEYNDMGINSKAYVEKRIRFLESGAAKNLGGGKGRSNFRKDYSVG